MGAVDCVIGVEPARVFAVLADGWNYPLWVVGATHMRRVDPDWPAVGARLHHSIGVWPLSLNDHTEVLAVHRNQQLVLRAHAGPGGSARIDLELRPAPQGTRVSMLERADSGPGQLIPGLAQDVLLRARNIESLHRLRSIAENQTDPECRYR